MAGDTPGDFPRSHKDKQGASKRAMVRTPNLWLVMAPMLGTLAMIVQTAQS